MKAANSNNKCPVCDAPTAIDFHPFCCGRCQDVDLGRWFNGNYAIPTDETPTNRDNEDEFDQ